MRRRDLHEPWRMFFEALDQEIVPVWMILEITGEAPTS